MQGRWLLIIGVVLVLLGAGGWLLKGRLAPAKAGIQIETTPQTTIFVNGEQVGTTPFERTFSPGEITLRLVPIAVNGPLSTWETKLTLTEGITTVVRRDFGETNAFSAGEVLSFEKIPGNTANITVVSVPDPSQVKLDGQVKGFTPLPIESVSVGEHEINLSHPGYKDRTVLARAEAGYKLTVIAMLAEEEKAEEQQTEEEEEKPTETQVEILDTPTGFLRVRMEPTTAATEAAKVDPGKKYPYIGENENGSWFKIRYEDGEHDDGKEGWISAQYAKKIE